LFQLGFGARIQSTSNGKYVGSGASGSCVMVDEAHAPVWNLVSRDFAVGEVAQTPRCAVSLRSEDSRPQMRYLNLRGAVPAVTEAPAVVRITLPLGMGISPRKVDFGFRQVLQEKRRLTTHGAATSSATALASETANGKSERFRLHVLVSSIGRDGVSSRASSASLFVSVVEALSLAVLELGVRFRLRSVHGRVLRTPLSGPGAGAATNDADGINDLSAPAASAKKTKKKKNKDIVLVLQDGPQSSVDETLAGEIVFEALRRANCFVFTSVEDNCALSVRSTNLELSRAQTLRESAALLLPLKGTGESQQQSNLLNVLPADNRWGYLHVGASVEVNGKQQNEWLMAGMRGRLETRHHLKAWESFRVEYVKQSLDAALRELPFSDMYANADCVDRARVRAEVAAQVAAARSTTQPGATVSVKKTAKKSGFNHAAALCGLDGDLEQAEKSKKADFWAAAAAPSAPVTDKKGSKSSKRKKSGNGTRTASAATVGPVTSSALPRNIVSRSADKKAKARAKKVAKKAAFAASNGGDRSSGGETAAGMPSSVLSAAGSGSSTSGSDGEPITSKGSEECVAPDKASSSTANTSLSTGPPCSACARVVTGTYTKALGKNFHPQCFCCRTCRRPLLPGASQFRQHGGVPYCNGCYAANIAPKCARCVKPIMETVVTAMEKTWHKDCLTCTICRLPLTQQFFLYADKPNEPRCSRCVTGSEETIDGIRYGRSSGRVVNLPGPLFRQGGSTGGLSMNSNGGMSPVGGNGAAPGGGRARLTSPVLPAAARR
jgi:LIM domain